LESFSPPFLYFPGTLHHLVSRVAGDTINILYLKSPAIKIFTMTIRELFSKNKTILVYSISLGLLLFLLKWLQLRFIIFDHALEVYIGAIALLFTALGIWLTLKLTRPKQETITVEKQFISTTAMNLF
jgi:hypothetical protein